MQAKEIAHALARDAEAVARLLLPNGKRVGAEWECGSVEGEEGHSLKVHLAGDKAGVWSDFAAGEAGDLLDLWAKSKRQSIAQAMEEARSYLGIYRPQFSGYEPKQYQRPKKPKCSAPSGRVLAYLTEDRKLTPETLQAYKVAGTPEDGAVLFPYLLPDGTLAMCKRLKLERIDGKKDIRPTEAGCEPCLFGWQAIPDHVRRITITEGEIDAMSSFQMGYPALSVPFGGGGGGKHHWIETEYDRLERFDEIFLCLDRDREGEIAAKEIAERLGIHRCRIVEILQPWKDANELLQAAQAFEPLVERARYLDPAELKSASVFVEEVIRELYPPDDYELGFDPPWPKLEGKLKFRWSEITIFNGVNGHGKSQGAGQIALAAAHQGERVCIASLELKPCKLLMRLTLQAAGNTNDLPSIPYVRAIHEWYRDKLWIFDVVGTAKTARLLQVFRYARKRYGVRVFIVDSLMKCGIDETDYDGQKRLLDQLCDFKNEHDCHVLLITHSRKGDSEEHPTGKWDVKGSGAIVDLADTGLTIWRNKKKEAEIARLEVSGETVPEDIAEKPDAVLYCWKQRNGDWEKQAALWWHQPSMQFIERRGDRLRQYVEFRAEPSSNTAEIVVAERLMPQPIGSPEPSPTARDDPLDDRVHCTDCRNHTGGYCKALRPGRRVAVIDDSPRRCLEYAPLPEDHDRRTGRERWPTLVNPTK